MYGTEDQAGIYGTTDQVGIYGTTAQIGAETQVYGTDQYGAEMYGTTTEQATTEQTQVEQAENDVNAEQNPAAPERQDIPTLESEERVAKKVVELMKAAEIPVEQPKKKKQIRNDHLLAKMDEILTEVRSLKLK